MKTESQKELRFIPANEVTIPVHFPKVYKTREGRTIVYLGAILEERENMTIRCSPFWAEGRHSVDEDISKTIKGFYRLKNGIVFRDSFIDSRTFSSFDVAEADEYVDLPNSASTYYGIRTHVSQKEDKEATREAFGLTYDELSEILDSYGRIYGLGNIYFPYPKVTRSTQRDNVCDLSHAWIPEKFPYVAFDNSGYLFSHVSLGAFYEHLRLLLLHRKRSRVWKSMIENGVSEELLERVMDMQNYDITPVRYAEYAKDWY